jgi:ribosomal protein S6E (S10)
MMKTRSYGHQADGLCFFVQVPGDSLGDEFKGYLFKITGGNDKQGMLETSPEEVFQWSKDVWLTV